MSSLGKQNTSIVSYTKDFIESFANINILPLMNCELTLILSDPLTITDFTLLELDSSKSIIVLIFLSVKKEVFLSWKLSFTVLFSYLFSFFFKQSTASKSSCFLFFNSVIRKSLNGSSLLIKLTA